MIKFKFLFLLLIWVTGCTESHKSHLLKPADFEIQLKNNNGILVDVRTSIEFEEEAINGAVNISVEDPDFILHISELDKNKFYFIYCGIGKRSARACNIMDKYGFIHVYDLDGGLTQWKMSGLPVLRKSMQTKNNNSINIK